MHHPAAGLPPPPTPYSPHCRLLLFLLLFPAVSLKGHTNYIKAHHVCIWTDEKYKEFQRLTWILTWAEHPNPSLQNRWCMVSLSINLLVPQFICPFIRKVFKKLQHFLKIILGDISRQILFHLESVITLAAKHCHVIVLV